MSDWKFDEEYRIWELRVGDVLVWIQQRPYYCDRGHFIGKVDGLRSIDGADAFPRYYMDLDSAKLELARWLEWRLECERRK